MLTIKNYSKEDYKYLNNLLNAYTFQGFNIIDLVLDIILEMDFNITSPPNNKLSIILLLLHSGIDFEEFKQIKFSDLNQKIRKKNSEFIHLTNCLKKNSTSDYICDVDVTEEELNELFTNYLLTKGGIKLPLLFSIPLLMQLFKFAIFIQTYPTYDSNVFNSENLEFEYNRFITYNDEDLLEELYVNF